MEFPRIHIYPPRTIGTIIDDQAGIPIFSYVIEVQPGEQADGFFYDTEWRTHEDLPVCFIKDMPILVPVVFNPGPMIPNGINLEYLRDEGQRFLPISDGEDNG